MPKLKIQTTETGITATVKYPEEQAAEIMRLYGREVKIVEDVPDPTPGKTMDNSLDAQFDRIQDAIDALRRQYNQGRAEAGKFARPEDFDMFKNGGDIDPNLEAK